MKHQLRLNPSDEEENQHLELLIGAATSHASQYLGRPIPWLDEDGEPVPVPDDVKMAILMLVSDLYENREAQIVGVSVTENRAVQDLLHFHRVGFGV